MPIPSRGKDEDKSAFMSRCMSELSGEYKDDEQRTAICLSKATEGLDYLEAGDFSHYYNAFGLTEEINEDNFYVPTEADYEGWDDGEVLEWDWASDRPGLWENIRRKKEREGKNYKPAKTVKEGRPTQEQLKRAQSKELQKDVYDNPGEAMKRAKELGLDGIHDHPSKKDPGKKVYMPGKTHDAYEKKIREEMSKAEVESYADHLEDAEALQRGKPGPNDPRKTPAPKKDQKKGSKRNKPDSAKDDKGKITFSKQTEARLREIVSKHNAKGKGPKATLGMLKAVYRRGAGAFSTSHAPKMSRDGWAMARVRAFLYLLRNGRPSNPNYKQDNDLLPSGHKRSSKGEAIAYYEYEDPKTGQVYTYNRKGIYKKDGRFLVLKQKFYAEEVDYTESAEYQGRKVKLGKPFRTPNGPKKSAVYVKNDKGKVVIVRFGDPNMKIKKNIPDRRKSFRARHNCDNPGPRWKARYWSCKAW